MAKLPDGLVEELARAISEALTNLHNQPTAFLVSNSLMGQLMLLRRDAKIAIADHDKRIRPERVFEVLSEVWDDCKLLTDHDLDQVCKGLKMIEEVGEANQAALTPDWVNCY